MRTQFQQYFLLLAVWLFAASGASAQMERTIYQTFAIDSAAVVNLDLVGFTEVEILTWAGNTVLSEVNIKIWDASPEILNYFVDNGRYQFKFEKNGATASIVTEVRERKVIKTKISGPRGCQEITTLRLFVPDNYFWNSFLEGDSDGTIISDSPEKMVWQSGYSGNSQEATFEERNKQKLIKTLHIKE